MIRKQSIIAGLLLTPCLMVHGHDFHYYEQKTRELLPLLGINEIDVTFQVTHKEVSLQQRQTKPKTIFLNIEKLIQLNPDAALFECALQANLTTLDWNKLTAQTTQSLIQRYEKTACIAAFYIWFSCLFGAEIFRSRVWSSADKIKVFLGMLSIIGGHIYLQFYSDHTALGEKQNSRKKDSFDYEFREKLIDTIYSLLLAPTMLDNDTAHLAYAGFEKHLEHIPNYHIKDMNDDNWENDIPHTKQGVLLTFNEWIRLHPDAWQKIKKQLKQETIALIESIPVANQAVQ